MTALPIKSLHEHIVSLAKKDPQKMALVATDPEGTIAEEITYGELAKILELRRHICAASDSKKGTAWHSRSRILPRSSS